MSTPSLLNIPYVIKAGTLYSQIPETGAGDFTVTRATTPTANRSTRINADGFIELVNDNVPRLDYPLGGAVNGCASLLVEPSATNLVLRSEEFDNAYWVKVSGGVASAPVVTLNAEISPDGTMNADRIVFNLNGGVLAADLSQLESASITHAAAAHTRSIYARTTDGTNKVFNFVSPSGAVQLITITPTWQRFTATDSSSASSPFRLRLRGNEGTASSATIALWGAQYEAGSVATSYIPTSTQSIARGADVIRKTSITSLLGQSEGTVYFEVEVTDEARNRWFFTIDSASNSFIQAWISPTRTINIQIQNNSSIVMATLGSSALSVGYHKVAFAYNTATNVCIMYIDGVQNPVATRTIAAPGLPAFNNMSFGTYFSTTVDTLKAHVRAGAVYPNRLSNSELATLTTP